MTAFQRGKRGNLSIYVRMRVGRVQRSTGTTEKVIVRAMKQMCAQIHREQRWPILDAIRSDKADLSEVYGKLRPLPYTQERADLLELSLSAVNLVTHLAGWKSWVLETTRNELTAENYEQQVKTLVDGTFSVSELTKRRVIEWFASLTASQGTKRKYFYALKSFINYLRHIEVLRTDPLGDLPAPPKNPARLVWVEQGIDEKVVAAASKQYRAFFAFVHATGADVGSARRALVGDINFARGLVRIRGTKTDRREVHDGIIEAWALPILKDWIASQEARPGDELFPGITNSGANHHHERCARKAGLTDYNLKDARHSIAVRMRHRGYSFEQIAEQLGNTVAQVASVYARFKPEVENREIPVPPTTDVTT